MKQNLIAIFEEQVSLLDIMTDAQLRRLIKALASTFIYGEEVDLSDDALLSSLWPSFKGPMERLGKCRNSDERRSEAMKGNKNAQKKHLEPEFAQPEPTMPAPVQEVPTPEPKPQPTVTRPFKVEETDEELNDACQRVLERIRTRYKDFGTAIFYTKNNAKEDLGIESDLFYRAIRKLENDGELYKMKTKTDDGKTINKFVPANMPTPPKFKFLSEEYRASYDGPSVRTHFSLFYKTNPIIYDEAWDKETFIEKNSTLIDGAMAGEMNNICSSKKSYEDHLWFVVTEAAKKGQLVDAQ